MKTTKFKLPSLGITDKTFNGMSFGRQIYYWKRINEFKASAKTVWVSQKRKTTAKTFKEFIDLYQPSAYFAQFHNAKDYRDDTFEIFYI